LKVFKENRRNRKISSVVMMLGAICEGSVAVAIVLMHRSPFAELVGGTIVLGAIIVIGSSIVLWRTAGRLPE
jgi:hypothetical protein